MNNKFQIRCVKTTDGRFVIGKTYSVNENGKVIDEYGDGGWTNTTETFEAWYNACNWCDYAFELVHNNKIVITTNNNKTIARLYDGNKVIKSAEAKCNPDDTYCFETGANLAYVRLMGIEVKPTAVQPAFDWQAFKSGKIAVHCDTEAKAKAFLRECDGQGIRWSQTNRASSYTNYSTYGDQTSYEYDFGHLMYARCCWYKGEGYTVIECPFTSSEAVKTEPKYYSGRVVCIDKKDDCSFKLTVGKVYNVINGTMTLDDGYKTEYNTSLYVLGVALAAKFIPYRGIQI